MIEFDRLRHLAGVQRKNLTFFGDGRCKWLAEIARGQGHLIGRAAAGLASAVARDEGNAHLLARKRVLRQVMACQPFAVAAVAARNLQLEIRQTVKRRRLGIGIDRYDFGVGFLDAVVVLDFEADFERAVGVCVRNAVKSYFRWLVGDHFERPGLAVDGQFAALFELQHMGAGDHRVGASWGGAGIRDRLHGRRRGGVAVCRRLLAGIRHLFEDLGARVAAGGTGTVLFHPSRRR